MCMKCWTLSETRCPREAQTAFQICDLTSQQLPEWPHQCSNYRSSHRVPVCIVGVGVGVGVAVCVCTYMCVCVRVCLCVFKFLCGDRLLGGQGSVLYFGSGIQLVCFLGNLKKTQNFWFLIFWWLSFDIVEFYFFIGSLLMKRKTGDLLEKIGCIVDLTLISESSESAGAGQPIFKLLYPFLLLRKQKIRHHPAVFQVVWQELKFVDGRVQVPNQDTKIQNPIIEGAPPGTILNATQVTLRYLISPGWGSQLELRVLRTRNLTIFRCSNLAHFSTWGKK